MANTAPTLAIGDGKLTTDFRADYDSATSVIAQADGKLLVVGTSAGDFAVARYNANGSLDTAFDSDGRLTIDFGSAFDEAKWVSVQSDGKILVTGTASSDLVIARYNPDGSPDTSFDNDGKLVIHGLDVIDSLVRQADGKFLAAGSSYTSLSHYDIAVNRYNADGTPDLSFGGDGKVSMDMGNDEFASSAAVQIDGKIVVAGNHYTGSDGRYDIALVRYNADGTLDTSFDFDGQTTIGFGATSNNHSTSLCIQTDGKILVAGYSANATDGADFALVRFNSDGSLDGTFGVNGKIITSFGAGSDQINSIALQSDGRIVAAGHSIQGGHGDFALVRYNADGTLDTSFSGDGTLATNLTGWTDSDDRARYVTIQSDGKIVVAGISDNGIVRNDANDFALARYNADGSIDTTFDTGNPIYIIGDAAVVLNANAQVYDGELAAIGNYAGATAALSRHGEPSVEDVFSASGNLEALVEGGALVLSGMTIGTVTTNSAGTLLLTFNSNASQVRINEALSSLAYVNHGDAPPGGVQLDWVISDGNTGGQGTGGPLTASASTTVSVIFNHAPTLSNPISNDTAIAGSPFSFVVPANTFADVDAGDTLSYTATLSNGTALPDWLVFDGASHSFSGVPPSSAVGGLHIRVTSTDTSAASVSDVFLLTIGDLITGTTDDDTISGTLNPDVIHGLEGNDRLIGSEGNDTLDGGAGDDVLIGEAAPTDLTLSGYGGGISVFGSDTHVDVLIGGDGNDSLDDWIGNNTMIGGAGDDTYVGSFVELIELPDGGVDTILSYGTLSLPDNVENVTLLGSYSATVTGNDLDNRLIGNSGRNVLIGGAGIDTIDGGAENDQLAGGTGADNLQGGEGDDAFFLASVSEFAPGEVIDGGAGMNELRYTGDADATLVLTASVSGIGTIRIADVGGDWAGTARINVDATAALGNYGYLDIVGNAGNNILIGNAQANSLYGGFGNDTLVGSTGDDVMNGNDGSDVFLIASGADHGPNEWIDGEGGVGTPNGNFNEIRFTSTTPGDTLVLSSHISNIAKVAISSAAGDLGGTIDLNLDASALSAGISLTGNTGANRITGTVGADTIDGTGGSDTLSGGAGSDIFRFTAKTDSTAAAMDIVTDFASGDTLDFVGLQGITRQPLSYAYGTNVATTLSVIQGDASVSDTMVFFNDGNNGYLYIKGSGSGVDFDGSLIQLEGHAAILGLRETGLNAAPSISGTSSLPSVAEDSAPASIRVSDLLAGTDYSDADFWDLQGIAVVGAEMSSLGVWVYSTDGSTWDLLFNTSSSEALLLDANSEIRFLPLPNSTGTASLTLRAWDQTSGIASTHDLPQFANTWINGGTAAFSSGIHDLQVAVTPANDAPSILLGASNAGTYSGPNYAGGTSIGIQADGKIVLVGGEDDRHQTDNADFVVARFDVDGSLDASFGFDGKVATGIRSGADWARDVAIQQDGKIVVAGYGEEANGNDADVVVVRYNVDGSLDTSFSGDGRLTTNLGSTQDSAYSVAVQDDGKILVAGSRGYYASHVSDLPFSTSTLESPCFALARYNLDGTLDASFNADGIATASFTGSTYTKEKDIAILGDGKILIAGTAGIFDDAKFAMARFNADGSLDTSFSGDGKLTTDIGSGYSYASALAVQADGKILLAGVSGQQFAVARYDVDGSLDASFGGDGIVTTALESIFSLDVKGIVAQNDGKILVSGYGSTLPIFSLLGPSDPTTEIAPGVTIPIGHNPAVLVRYNADGSPDAGFATGGILVANAGAVTSIQADGKILVAGGDGFALARYNSDGMPDASFGIPTYREQGAPVVLDRTATVSDIELSVTGNYAGASLTLARHSGADSHDAFFASGNLGPLTPGDALTLSGAAIGVVSANADGSLTLTFDANATQLRVNETLRSIAYANTGVTSSASVQIDWSFSDGNTEAQGSGGALVATGSTLVNIVAANNVPTGIVGVGGTATQGHVLAVTDTLADVDGLGIISYQWQSSLDGTLWSNADSGPTLTLTADLVGQQIRAVASYTDGNGTTESIASLATSKVAGYQSGTLDNDSLLGTAYADTLLGLAGNDRLVGGGGNDRLDGGRGADQMEGGNGNDLYVVDQRFDQITELADSGIDSVSAKVGHVLADHVENLYLTGSVTLHSGGFFSRKTTTIDLNIDGTGNASDNLLRGNRGHNQLDGLDGNDTLLGGAGADVLSGGTGADRLLGGAGADVFVFAAGDGSLSLTGADLLYDFEDGIDRIALAGGLDFADLTISQGNGIDTATGNTVIGTGSGEYLVVLLHTSTSAITGVDFQVLA